MNKLLLILTLITLSIPNYNRGVSLGTATLISVGGSVSGDIRTVNIREYYKIYIPKTESITISTTGSLDTYGYLLDSNGNTIASNDDDGGNFNFSITRTLSSGIYYIKVQAYNLGNKGTYLLSVRSSSGPSSGNNVKFNGNSISSATSINIDSATSGTIASGNDIDFFKISIEKAGNIVIQTTGSLDTYGYLLNSSGEIITHNDDGDNSNFKITRMLEVGVYYIKVKAYNLGDVGSYSLLVGFSDTATPTTPDPTPDPTPDDNTNATDHGDSISSASLITTSSTTSASIEVVNDNDYFKIIIPSGGTITARTTGTLDTQGTLLSPSGSTIVFDDDGGSGSNFEFIKEVTAGTYYIKVNAYGTGTGAYSLFVNFTVTPSSGSGQNNESDDISSAKLIGANSTTYANIRDYYDRDYYTVVVQKPGTLIIMTTGSTDTFGYLLNEDGGTISVNDDGGNGSNFQIIRRVPIGNYKIRIKGYSSGDNGNYALVVRFAEG